MRMVMEVEISRFYSLNLVQPVVLGEIHLSKQEYYAVIKRCFSFPLGRMVALKDSFFLIVPSICQLIS